MKALSFGIAAVLMGFLGVYFGLVALAFAIGHLWYDALVHLLLTLVSGALMAIYSGMLALECLIHPKESRSNTDVS
jgi:hypothetical protein